MTFPDITDEEMNDHIQSQAKVIIERAKKQLDATKDEMAKMLGGEPTDRELAMMYMVLQLITVCEMRSQIWSYEAYCRTEEYKTKRRKEFEESLRADIERRRRERESAKPEGS